jgi:hypothetical protein
MASSFIHEVAQSTTYPETIAGGTLASSQQMKSAAEKMKEAGSK